MFCTTSTISIHALLAESDIIRPSYAKIKNISIHALLAESDRDRFNRDRIHQGISIHALLAESDMPCVEFIKERIAFLSTLSLRRATWKSTDCFGWTLISIHALLAESDSEALLLFLHGGISIHALLAESDTKFSSMQRTSCRFLSTLSLRRATVSAISVMRTSMHFYPRSPCGERRGG